MAKTKKIPDPKIPTNEPVVDFKYLKYSPVCIGKVSWALRDDRENHDRFFKVFHNFVHDFSACSTIGEALRMYSSRKNGSREFLKKNETFLKFAYHLPEQIRDYAIDECIHLHLKRGGKDKEVLMGFMYNSTFHVIGIDLDHEFNE